VNKCVSAPEQSTPEACVAEKKNKNAGRGLKANMKAFLNLLPFDDMPTPDEVTGKVEQRARELRGDDRTLDERQLDLFGPGFAGWDEVGSAALDDRELPIPDALLPQTRDEALRLCAQLIDRGENGDLVNLVTESWDIDFERFVNRLWQTAADDRPFFNAVVSGRHRSAFFYMRDVRIPLALTPALALALIANMGLLWCAHDVQLTAARLRRAARRPLGKFLPESKLLSVATVHRVGRRLFHPMKRAFDAYCTDEELAQGKRPPKTIGHAFEILFIRRHVEDSGIPTEGGPGKKFLDRLVVRGRAFLEKVSDPWWDEIRLKKPSGLYSRTKFSQIWWSGLDGLQPLAVSILRLLQVEVFMSDLVAEVYRAVNPRCSSLVGAKFSHLQRTGAPAYGFLPAFAVADLNPGWRERGRLLMTGYRRAIVMDGDLDSGKRAAKRSLDDSTDAANDDTFFEPAIAFLTARGERKIADHEGGPTCERRTFYLLDVLADIRLSR
jgi:hypothetical protein